MVYFFIDKLNNKYFVFTIFVLVLNWNLFFFFKINWVCEVWFMLGIFCLIYKLWFNLYEEMIN